MSAAPRLLLVRPDDMVVLGVGWTGCEVVGNALVPVEQGAAITVTFPPQAVAEATLAGATVQEARLAGPSALTVRLAGAAVALTADAILAELRQGEIDGRLEIPFGLIMAPTGPEGPVRARHAVGPVRSPAGVVGLWSTRLEAPGGLLYTPIDTTSASGPDTRPLDAGLCNAILLAGAGRLDRLSLSSLGGTLTAHATTGSFEWQHDMALGRDRDVRVVRDGVLYPFGHRASLIEAAERVVEGGVARLRRTSQLVVHDAVRAFPGPQTKEGRAFPFDEVELLTAGIPDVGAQLWVPWSWPNDVTDALASAVAGAEAAHWQARDALSMVRLPTSDQELADSGLAGAGDQWVLFSAAPRLEEIRLELEALAALEWLSAADHERKVALERERDQIYADTQAAYGAVQNAWALIARGVGDLDAMLALGVPEAVAVRDTAASLAALKAEEAAHSKPLDLMFVPCGPDGRAFPFPVRARGGLGDVVFSTPLVFVAHLVVGADGWFPGYDSYTDWRTPVEADELLVLVRAEEGLRDDDPFAGVAGARIGLPGVPIDLVRAAERRSTDVQEIHALVVGAEFRDGVLQPALDRVQAELQELRALIPHAPSRAVLAFGSEYLAGEATEVALEIPSRFPVDFAGVADRAGALLHPTFTADAISRTRGLIDAQTLGGPDQVLAALADMTLLGISLPQLLETVPAPPEIVQLLSAGAPPGVRMAWEGLTLRSAGPFRATGPAGTTRLDLVVERSVATQTIDCDLSAFALELPPGSGAVIQLDVASLAFRQEGGRPPRLEVGRVDVRFLGSLKLLEDLQKKVDLGPAAPSVRARPTGLSASYSLAVPSASAVVFEIRDVAFRLEVDVPFDRGSPSVSVAFSSREDPFRLTVLSFGGGGYVLMRIVEGELRQIEASLHFGASAAIDFGIVTAEVHVDGGVRFVMLGDEVAVTGFVRLGGSVDVLGLVTVSVNLLVELTYHSDPSPRLVGRATLVIEIDVTLYADTIELDSGEWTLVGGAAPADEPAGPRRLSRQAWADYRNAYA